MQSRRILGLAFVLLFALSVTIEAQDLPKPKLRFVRVSEHVNDWGQWKMYEVEVENREEFDNELFVPSPALPPCGRNANASRTWVHVYDGDGKRIYGWCGINASGELASLKFNVSTAKPQPRSLFIEFIDRASGTIRRSETIKID